MKTTRDLILAVRDRHIAEEATGCAQGGRLKFMDVGGEYNGKEAKRRLWAGEEVAVPAAGAGSYNDVFSLLGFDGAELYESGSSAGDWTLMVHSKSGWRLAFQENRYPYHGFRYSIGTDEKDVNSEVFETKKDLIDFFSNLY